MKAGIVIFPGINRERDMAIALRRSGAEPRMVWHKETDLAVSYLERIARLYRFRGDDKEALRVYRRIATIAPYREDVLALLLQAHRSGGLDSCGCPRGFYFAVQVYTVGRCHSHLQEFECL